VQHPAQPRVERMSRGCRQLGSSESTSEAAGRARVCPSPCAAV
jgi:hypothetical protein